jgi:hypothetical protein
MEDIIPSIADFISLSATSAVGTDMSVEQKKQINDDLGILLEQFQAIPDLPLLIRDQVSTHLPFQTCRLHLNFSFFTDLGFVGTDPDDGWR